MVSAAIARNVVGAIGFSLSLSLSLSQSLHEFCGMSSPLAYSSHPLHGTRKRSLVVGVICDVFNIMMYVSPLTVMISNGIGAISGLVQLILYASYSSCKNQNDDEVGDHNLKPTGVQLT
ncbi:hypothetical protein Fmac_016851 [Flemingia macrophylla]|uniref:Uncharacterized protein n=1 Tax=Flemingia macrophylla TaxID=520843 RepID=A0ABD1MII9_9FABA